MLCARLASPDNDDRYDQPGIRGRVTTSRVLARFSWTDIARGLASQNYEETMSTLRYAESAKKVINRAVVNEDKNARIIRQLRQEIEELRAQLATVKKSPKRKASSAGLSASLSEREDFYQQLQKEVDFFRGQQQQQQLRESEEATPAPQMDAVLRLHRALPSLVNLNAGLIPGEDAIAYVLTEGTTVFGSQPSNGTPPAQTSIEETTTGENSSPKSRKGRGSWSPTLLKKRTSFLGRTAADTATNDTADAVVDDVDEENDLSSPDTAAKSGTSANCKLVETHAVDVTPQHACFVCSRVESTSAPDIRPNESREELQDAPEDGTLAASTPSFVVEVQALDEDAVLKVNGVVVTVGDRRQIEHGDEVELGRSFRLRLHGE